jgi:hypothetical protein
LGIDLRRVEIDPFNLGGFFQIFQHSRVNQAEEKDQQANASNPTDPKHCTDPPADEAAGCSWMHLKTRAAAGVV